MKVAVIDYGSGNLRSAVKSFERAAREAGERFATNHLSIDDAYFEKRARIGRMHVKVGLEQRYMLAAMLQSPNFLWRSELGTPREDGSGRRNRGYVGRRRVRRRTGGPAG